MQLWAIGQTFHCKHSDPGAETELVQIKEKQASLISEPDSRENKHEAVGTLFIPTGWSVGGTGIHSRPPAQFGSVDGRNR